MIIGTKDELYESLEHNKYLNGIENFLVRKKGTSHVVSGTACQDYCITDTIDNLLITAVADGHGGEAYERSDIGSRLACEKLVELVKGIYNESVSRKCTEAQFIDSLKGSGFKKTYLQKWKEGVLNDYRLSCNDEVQISESSVLTKYGTTLLFSVITKQYIVCGQIGDGAILLFNENGIFQFHRRPGNKVGSMTPSSLCSSRARFSIMVESYQRKIFNNVLLSTDGIYDKLAIKDSFYLYALKLTDKAKNGDFSQNPFHITNKGKEMDLHILSKDDCTLSLVLMDQSSIVPLYNREALSDYTDVVFARNISDYCFFNAYKDGLKYCIHKMNVHKLIKDAQVISDGSFTIIKSKTITTAEGDIYYIYPVLENTIDISLLIESYENLEKSYSDYNGKYNNTFWLSVLQKVNHINNMIKEKGVCFSDLQYCVMSVDDNGHLLIYDDGFVPVSENQISKALFDSYFSIIGKIVINESEIPLFAPNPNGQAITFTINGETLKFCRTLLNVQNGDVWLENLSDYKWTIDNNKSKVVEKNHYLRLSGDKRLSFQNGKETIEAIIIMF